MADSLQQSTFNNLSNNMKKLTLFYLMALVSLGVLQIGTSRVFGQANCLLNEHFQGGDGGFTVVNAGNPTGPWLFDNATGSWKANGSDNLGAPSHSRLNSPVVNVAQNGEIFLSFCHRYSFEDSGFPWDGGAVFVSVNSGPFVQVPDTAFTQNGYNVASFIGNHDLNGDEGYGLGDSPGYGSGDKIESIASLGTLSAGDTVQVQFLCAWDEFSKGSEPNWEICGVVIGDCGVGACQVDSDGDGVLDDVDDCPDSLDVGSTVKIGGLDSGVENILIDGGCTLSDLIQEIADNARNHGQFVSAVAALENFLRANGILTQQEAAMIQNTAARSSLP